MAEENINQEQEEAQAQEVVFKDEDVFKYVGEKLGKEINSFDDFVVEKEVIQEKEIQTVPDYLKRYDEFYKQTNGKPLEEFVKYNKDWSSESEEKRMSEYLRRTKPHLDSEDIAFKISEMKNGLKASEDDDIDDPMVQRKLRNAEIEWKESVHNATQLLESEKSKVIEPLPNPQNDINEGKEEFKREFAKTISETDSIKIGDLDYKFSKESVKGVETLEDILTSISSDKDGKIDMEKALKFSVLSNNLDQVVADLVNDAIVKYKDSELIKKNNAAPEAKESSDKAKNSSPSNYAKAFMG